MNLFEAWILTGLHWGVLGLALWALIDSITRPTAAFAAAEKLTKPAWMGINGVALIAIYFNGVFSIFALIAIVAIGVYLADVRPAVRSLGRGESRW